MEKEKKVKVCSLCLKEKYYREFYAIKGNPNKRQNPCKECRKEQQRMYYKEHRESIIGYMKDYYKKNKLKMLDYNAEWRMKNHERVLEYRANRKARLNAV